MLKKIAFGQLIETVTSTDIHQNGRGGGDALLGHKWKAIHPFLVHTKSATNLDQNKPTWTSIFPVATVVSL